MKRILKVGASFAIAFVLLYLGDYLSLRFRIPGNRPQFGSVHLQPYLAVPQKNGRIEYILEDPLDQTCVHSIFPHLGCAPCWYLQSHRRRQTDL